MMNVVNSVVLVVNQILAKFELELVDFQGLDAGLKSRCWNSKLGCRPCRSGNPAPSGGQRRLDNLTLTERLSLPLDEWRRFNQGRSRKKVFGKPQFVNCKNVARAQDYRPLNYVLQFPDGRHFEGKHIEPVKEVLAKGPIGYCRL